MCPQRTLKGGELPPLANLPPLAGGLGDVPPRTLKGGELPPLATRPRVGPKTLANPQPTGVGKTGVQGAKPPGRGWGMCPRLKSALKRSTPTLIKAGVEGAKPPGSPRVGPKTSGAGKPSAHEGGQNGGPGGEAPWQGAWGIPPQTIAPLFKRLSPVHKQA
jgi:hypothetical protein